MYENGFDQAISFSFEKTTLYGILSLPVEKPKTAVIIVVGGPQFRVGSHRQFALLARSLAMQGILALRFDYSGMGYSEGVLKSFFEIDQDIEAAVDFVKKEYSDINNIYLWGLCDAASAITFCAYKDTRIKGIVILNPWVRNEDSHSKVILKNYYWERFFSLDVWRELLVSPQKIMAAVSSFANVCFKVILSNLSSKTEKDVQEITLQERKDNLPASVLKGMHRFTGNICLILSGKDLTADEFKRELDTHGWLDNHENKEKTFIHHLREADHTFSSSEWRGEVERLTLNFVTD